MDKEQVVQVLVGNLKASEWNRTDLGNGDLKQLADNIGVDGVLVPLIVRPINGGDEAKKGTLEIVAGHRRWQAAKIAGMMEVPCIIRELDDVEAKKVQVLENLHRKNLNPMEEAHAFTMLMEGNVHSAQTVAEYVGKDAKYVHRALALLNLPKKAQVALEKGILSAAHGHQLARVGPKQIETITEFAMRKGWKGEVPTISELKAEIGRKVEKKLSAAPFEKNREFAGKIACKGCPSNTANQDMLFDGAEEGYCTNGTCFAAKIKQFYRDLEDTGKKRWPFLKFIGTASSSYGDNQTIKGYVVCEEKDPKIKKAIDAAKEQIKKDPKLQVAGMGFGIVKPSNWGSVRVARLVMLRLGTKKESNSQYKEATPEERAQNEHFRQFMKGAEAEYIFRNAKFDEHVWRALIMRHASDQWDLDRAAPWLRAAGINTSKPIKEQIAKQEYGGMTMLSWLLLLEGDQAAMRVLLDHNEMDLKKLSKGWSAEAMKNWKEHKDQIMVLWKKTQEERS